MYLSAILQEMRSRERLSLYQMPAVPAGRKVEMTLDIRSIPNKLLSMAAALCMAVQAVPLACCAAETKTEAPAQLSAEEPEVLYTEQETYSDYYDLHKDDPRPHVVIDMEGTENASYACDDMDRISVGSYGTEYGVENRDNVLIWNAPDGSVTFAADIPETGCYNFAFTYLPIPSNMADIEFSVLIDGESPYDTATRATLSKVFVNDGEISYDSHGNQVRPSQKQTGLWLDKPLMDVDGLFNDPLLFYMEQGRHEITFEIKKGYFAIDQFRIYNPDPLPDYESYKSGLGVSVTPETTPSTLIRIEGENAAYKSDATLYPTQDNASYLASPADPAKTVYNTIGSGNWKQALQSITWTIPAEELPQDGWYKIGIKARQKDMRGFYSNRRIYIDNEVPCQELDQVRFYYGTEWQVVTPQDADGNDLYVFLTGGQDHTLTMEVMPGEIGESMRVLDAAVLDINTYYRKILMITGPNPDQYTDYYVHERIPELIPHFSKLSADLKRIQGDIETLAGSKGSEAAALERMYIILDACIERPLRIPDYLKQIKENITSLSAWMVDYRNQPLEVDYIELASADQSFGNVKPNVFKSAGYGIQRFCRSFFEDYTTLTDDAGEDAVNVWVSLGRDQALVVKSLVESEFTEQYDTPVAVNLVVGGVVEATLAGKGPDVALFLGGEFPVNLAARGLLVDLKEFPDYDQTAGRFQQYATVPYQYDDGCYGLPLTQSWAMLFYRKDILTELGYNRPPETWDDVVDMLPALQRNYMYMGLVLPAITGISAATESGHTYAALMLQNGLNYYNDDQTKTNFDNIAAVQAFEQWTDLYTKYGFEQTYDGFNRFRTGEYPLVIADYGFFNQLSVASPEIKGLWDFTSIPGTVQPDGSVSHAVNSTSSGAVIFKKCKNKEGAWKFLKWFTSTEVQVEFGTQIEGLLGQLGRYATANREAMQQLSWTKTEQHKLLAAQDELQEIPIIPASYAVTRNIMNAFRETVNEHENPRDTLLWYNRDINKEITRKRENLGLPT